jgi:chromosome segregation ATPase
MSLTKDDKDWVLGAIGKIVEASETRILGVINDLATNMDERFDAVDARFDKVEDRLDKVENRLDKVESRLDKVEFRLDKVESHINSLEYNVQQFQFTVSDNTKHLENIMLRMGTVENQLLAINNDLDEIYTKLTKLEKAPKSAEKKLRTEVAKDILKVNEKVKLVAAQAGVNLPS